MVVGQGMVEAGSLAESLVLLETQGVCALVLVALGRLVVAVEAVLVVGLPVVKVAMVGVVLVGVVGFS